jgi:hypothetical protein
LKAKPISHPKRGKTGQKNPLLVANQIATSRRSTMT